MLFFGRSPRPAPAVPAGMRLYAIGDVHGRRDLLDTLLGHIRTDDATRRPARTILLQLGDMIDRGPDSAGVVRRLMTGLDWAEIVALRGNHEQAMADGLAGDPGMLRLWRGHGGMAAAISWGVDPALAGHANDADFAAAVEHAVPADQRAWLATRPLSARHGGYHFVHAGIRPGTALDRQTEADMLWIRKPFLDSRRDHGAVIVHGHSITAEPDCRPNRIGIDTGAHASSHLTALGLDGTDRWFLST